MQVSSVPTAYLALHPMHIVLLLLSRLLALMPAPCRELAKVRSAL